MLFVHFFWMVDLSLSNGLFISYGGWVAASFPLWKTWGFPEVLSISARRSGSWNPHGFPSGLWHLTLETAGFWWLYLMVVAIFSHHSSRAEGLEGRCSWDGMGCCLFFPCSKIFLKVTHQVRGIFCIFQGLRQPSHFFNICSYEMLFTL